MWFCETAQGCKWQVECDSCVFITSKDGAWQDSEKNGCKLVKETYLNKEHEGK